MNHHPYHHLFLIATVFPLVQPISVQAQQPTSAQLTQQFRDGYMKGCLQGKTTGVKNQNKYCICMADSYQSRFDGNTLAAISQISGSLGNQGPTLVNLMMSPAAKACRATS